MEFQNHERSLYERIGGEESIAKLVDHFYAKVVADPEIGYYFTHVPMGKLIPMQREFFAMATGGPALYSGRPLSEIHRPLAISRREFARFTEHLIETLQEIGIDEQDTYEIIAKINLYADEITNEATYGG
jgi:hemoglobin